jgi:asparagine synthase (glutamine-hydrolysing)
MNLAQRHRGPDGEGVYTDRHVGLAHTRLAIIDPAGGDQPFISEDGELVLVFNGEIYNYRELRTELAAAGCVFSTTSDTEVLLQSYRKWGIACLEAFRGMFAFALYDKRMRSLYLVRDRVGIKPLHFGIVDGRLVFASEMTAILAVPGVERRIDQAALSAYLRYQYVPAPMTIYESIRKLEPGHYLRVDVDTGVRDCVRYWDLCARDARGDCLDELDSLLDNTTRIYVRSDVPFGAFLSGGVDSSVVTGFMTRHLEAPVETFSIGYGEEQHSELPYALDVSSCLGTNHHAQIVSADIAEGLLCKLVRHFGEPFGDSSAVPTYAVSRLAADNVKMVLSGDGGDELFAGYDSYRAVFSARQDPLRALKRRVWSLVARLPLPGRIARGAARRCMDDQELQDSMREVFDEGEVSSLLVDSGPVYAHRFDRDPASDHDDPIACLQRQDFHTYLVDDVLTKVDRMSMACSLEVRVPLLDHEVAEFAFGLPLAMRIGRADGGEAITKFALKRVGDRFFRPGFLERPKMGFGIPVQEWLEGPLRPLVDHELRDETNPVFTLVRFGPVQALLNGLYVGKAGLAAKTWIILILSLWMREVHHGDGLSG